MSEDHTSTLYTSLRIFSWVVLLLVLASILYSGWISIANWIDIRV